MLKDVPAMVPQYYIPFCLFDFGVYLLRLNISKKGTHVIMGLLGNLVIPHIEPHYKESTSRKSGRSTAFHLSVISHRFPPLSSANTKTLGNQPDPHNSS